MSAPALNRRAALVTGGTGFVGAHLVRRLVGEGWETHVVTRPQSSLQLLGGAAGQVGRHVHDGTTESLLGIVGAVRPDVVFHLASLFLAHHTPPDVVPLIESNVRLGAQLLEAMRVHGVERLVNAGTSWQHYQNAGYSPVCLYAATKQAFESLVTYYVETASLRVISLALFDTYGPEDPRPKLFSLLRRARQNGEILAMSPGKQLVDLVHVDDVVQAFVLAAERLHQPDCERWAEYAVSSGRPLPLREVVALYEQAGGGPLPIVWGGRPYREREVMVPWNTGRRLPGWAPSISLEAGLRAVLEG